MANGRSNNGATICAGAGGIVCIVLFFVFGIPMFIASMVLFSISNGAYDEARFENYDDCEWSKWYDDRYEYDTGYSDCDQGQKSWDAWKDTKKALRIVAIVLLVICLVFLIAGISMLILMCYSMSKNRAGGTVHSETVVGMPVVQNTTAMYAMQQPPQPYPVQQVTNPMMPPPYNAAAPYPANQMPPTALYTANQMPPTAPLPANPMPQQHDQKY